jgi:polyhydroxyalkanoate synthase
MIGVDPISFLRALAAAGAALVKNPAGAAAANARLAIGPAAAARATVERAIGGEAPGPVSAAAGDTRFADAAYADNPLYFLLAQQYLLSCQLVTELLDAAGLEETQDRKARFAAQFILDARAPTNTLPGNPAAIRRAFDTGGKSLVRGAKTCWATSGTTGGGPRRSTAPGSRWASTWPPPPERSSTAAS